MSESWKKIVRKYTAPSPWKSNWQIANSLIPYAFSWWVAYEAYQYSLFLCLSVSLLAQVFLLRIFVVMHDCGHGSFFRSKRWSHFWGFICGAITFSPYLQWTRAHRYHHKHSGNLDYRGVGDIEILTVEEYEALTFWGKIRYKAVRSPFVFMLLGPFFIFILQHRFVKKEDNFKERLSVHMTNLTILAGGATISYIAGLGFYLFYQLSVVVLTAMAGVFLFYVQHQYEDVYWRHDEDWNHYDASIYGSSYLKLPRVLQWATGNIGFHHIHHLCSAIPNYNLEKAYKENKIFQQCRVLSLKDSFMSLFLNLYDMESKELISFREYRRRYKKKSLNSLPTKARTGSRA